MSRGAAPISRGSRLVIVVVVVIEVRNVDSGDHGAQLLGWLEHRHWARRHFDRRAGARVPRHASLALPDLEGAKAADFNVLLFLQGVLDRVEKRVDDPGTVLLGDRRSSRLRYSRRDVLHQIGFRHGLYQRFDARRQG